MKHRLLITVALVLSPSLAAGATFVVDSTLDAVDAVPGDGVCATAGGACTLRAAVQEANALSGGHVITLPAGTYALTIPGRGELSAATGDLNVTSTLTIHGDSTATTIIDANSLDRVFRAVSPGTALTLIDLTIRNGNPGNSHGGGIYVSGVDLTLARVVVTACSSGALGSTTIGGGGIFALGPSTVALMDATITQNTVTVGGANSGGGVYLSTATTATITRTTISSNSASFGGGIYVFGAGSPSTLTLTDTTVAQNQATSGGGVYLSVLTTASMTRATLSGNSASGPGGGIAVFSTASAPSTLAVTDTAITQNNTTGAGGGLSINGVTTATINRSTISGNSAGLGFSSGGGIDIAGAGPSTTISSTAIFGNSAAIGGGIGLSAGTVTVSNTTISGNTATSPGGAISTGGNAGSDMTLVNVTIASNSSGSDGAVRSVSPGQLQLRNTIIANSTGAAPANCSFAGTVTNLGNNLEFPGTACGFDMASDRRADPLLRVLAANGGTTRTHALGPGSPAIDAGGDATCAAAPVAGVDQRGSSRPTGAHCDIGAYESAIVPFTDDPLVATASVIRAMHVTELRSRINAIRVRFGLSNITWTNPNLSGLTVQAVHIQEMRSALLSAYSAAGRPPPSFTDPTLVIGGTVVRATHIAELRAAVIALE